MFSLCQRLRQRWRWISRADRFTDDILCFILFFFCSISFNLCHCAYNFHNNEINAGFFAWQKIPFDANACLIRDMFESNIFFERMRTHIVHILSYNAKNCYFYFKHIPIFILLILVLFLFFSFYFFFMLNAILRCWIHWRNHCNFFSILISIQIRFVGESELK